MSDNLFNYRLTFGDYLFWAISTPRTSLSANKIDLLMPQLVGVARRAFGSPRVTEADVLLHAFDMPYVTIVLYKEQVVGFGSMAPVQMTSGTLAYIAGVAIEPEHQGQGLYQIITALQILGLSKTDTALKYVGLRTQNPRLCKNALVFNAYPLANAGFTDHVLIAEELAKIVYSRFSAFQRPNGVMFDPTTGVMHGSYAAAMYETIPWSGDSWVDSVVSNTVHFDKGDALLVLWTLNLETSIRALRKNIARHTDSSVAWSEILRLFL